MQNIENAENNKIKVCFTPKQAFDFFSAEILNSEKILDFFLQNKYNCPKCGQVVNSKKQLVSYKAGKRIQCRNCGKFFNYKNNTIIDNSCFSAVDIYIFALFLYFKVPVKVIAEKLNINPISVYLWKNKFELHERLNNE